jgi:sulfur dioxygenase
MRNRNDMPGVRGVDAELLLQRLRSDGRVNVIDVRSHAEFRGPVGRIPSARSLPLDELVARRAELGGQESEPIVVVSRRGTRASIAVRLLEAAGFSEVAALEGGMQRWLDLGLPVEVGTQTYSLRPPAQGATH